jgi:RNA polymerase-binding protein DksA
LKTAERIKTEDKIMAARKRLLDMREELAGEGLGKFLPGDLARPFDIGDEGDRAAIELTQGVSVLLSVRDKEKLLAIDEALDKIQDGTYGECAEYGDEIGAGRLKAMPLAKLCLSCQSRLEKEQAHQKFAEEHLGRPLVSQVVPEEED